jgi:hypothetical protein
VLPLVRFYWELVLLRRAPQDLPSSPTLLGLVLTLNVLLGALGVTEQFGGFGRALFASLLDAAVTAGLVYATLRFAEHPARFYQTLTAIYGIAALFNLAMLVLRWVTGTEQLEALFAFASLVLLAWVHVAVGHVLRHALDTELWAGIAIAVAYTVIGLVLVSAYVAPVEPTGG